MTENNKKLIRIGYFALVSLALVAVAVLLMVACVNIYNLGDYPFTRELVAQEFDKIAIPVYVCLGLVVLGVVLHPLLPCPTDTDKDRDRMTVQRMTALVDLTRCPDDLANAIKKERQQRKLLQVVTVLLFIAGLAVLVWYALSFERFSMEDINGSFVKFGRMLLPCVGAPGVFGTLALFYNRKSYRREIELFRQVPAEAKVTAAPAAATPAWEKVVKLAVLVIATGLIVGGFIAGGWVDVLTKAINICTECVGLG